MTLDQESEDFTLVRRTVNQANIDVVINLLKKIDTAYREDFPCSSMPDNENIEKILAMSSVIIHESLDWPSDKVGRWVGFIQCLAVNEGIITIDGERDETRPIFHEAYKAVGFNNIQTKKV